MGTYAIPFDFLDTNFHISWCDVKWGYKNSLISSDVPIKKAEKSVLTGNYSNIELELSFFIIKESDSIDNKSNLKSNEIYDINFLLNKLCFNSILENDLTIKKKWLLIVLSWLWNNRSFFEDPLAEVEIIYADFDYPPDIDGFVKYMPPSDGYDPSMHSQEENINRLMVNWENYLKKESLIFKK